VSFADPLFLLGLLAIPLLVGWYATVQRRRVAIEGVFVRPVMSESPAPQRPRWRRHAPIAVFVLALAVLIAAAARPQRSVAEPVSSGAVMLANDVSGSMNSTDVSPSREGAAVRAGRRFVGSVPSAVQVGLIAFARTPTVLQAPSTDHALTVSALGRLKTSGGTALGDAILVAIHELRSIPKIAGKRPPGAIVLISDGGSNLGVDPVVAAREALAVHIPVYTIAVGTPHGTITFKRGSRTVTAAVPVSSAQLAAIAKASGGRAFTAADSKDVEQAYARLAVRLGHKQVKQEITASFAGGGLVLLLVGSAMSLAWFGRLV